MARRRSGTTLGLDGHLPQLLDPGAQALVDLLELLDVAPVAARQFLELALTLREGGLCGRQLRPLLLELRE